MSANGASLLLDDVQTSEGSGLVVSGLTTVDLHWLAPGLLCALVAGALLATPISALLKSNVVVVGALLCYFGSVIAMTVLAAPGQRLGVSRACAINPLSITGSDLLSNVILYFPIGVLIPLLRPRWAIWWAIAIAAVAPIVIEALQYEIVALGRACSVYDTAGNQIGLAIGLGLGFLVRAIFLQIKGRRATPSTTIS